MITQRRPIKSPIRIAVIGLGRIGKFHARHVLELGRAEKVCELTAVVDSDSARGVAFIDSLRGGFGDTAAANVANFQSVEELIAADVADAAIVCSATVTHQAVAEPLIEAGFRILMEKPMTESLEKDRAFTKFLNASSPDAVMLAFQRRFDAPLQHAKKLLSGNAIGRLIRIVSTLEDSGPPPVGYQSPGLLVDMAVHNVDEVVWLTGLMPVSATGVGSRVYNHHISDVVEDFDNASMFLNYKEEFAVQIDVSRVHTPGYHVETRIYGEQGIICVGAFHPDPLHVAVTTLRKSGAMDEQIFRMRDYNADAFGGEAVPEFVHRFGPAYYAELVDFVSKCQSGQPFSVDQNDGLIAGEIVAAGMQSASQDHSTVIDLS